MLRGLFLFTATAHGGGRQASSGEGEQAQTTVEGDGGAISCDVSTVRITVSWPIIPLNGRLVGTERTCLVIEFTGTTYTLWIATNILGTHVAKKHCAK